MTRSTQSTWSSSSTHRILPWSARSATFACTCIRCDHLIHITICKHILLVTRTTSTAATLQDACHISTQESMEVILQAIRQPPASPLSLGRNRLLARLDDLTDCDRECSSAGTLSVVERHIIGASSLLKAITSQAGGIIPDAPSKLSNKMALQRFKSTGQVGKAAREVNVVGRTERFNNLFGHTSFGILDSYITTTSHWPPPFEGRCEAVLDTFRAK